MALAGYQAFDAIDTSNCSYIQNYNVGDPQVPGDPGDYNYASSDEGVAIHGNTLYFADTGNDMVSVIDAATLNPKNYNPAETDIHVGINPDDLAVSPDGTQLWVADTGPQTGPGAPTNIDVISTATDTVTATLSLPSAPEQVAFSPSGGHRLRDHGGGTVDLRHRDRARHRRHPRPRRPARDRGFPGRQHGLRDQHRRQRGRRHQRGHRHGHGHDPGRPAAVGASPLGQRQHACTWPIPTPTRSR